MGLFDLLKLGKSKLGYSGVTPPVWPGDLKNSKLHDQYSLNGKPNVGVDESPSQLDINGKTPKQYLDNLPK